MTLDIITAHAGSGSLKECYRSWVVGCIPQWEGFPVDDIREGQIELDDPSTPCQTVLHNRRVFIENGQGGMLKAYQSGFQRSCANVLAFLHDDLIIKEEGWAARVLAEFEDPTVGLVGLGGALVHGSPELYKAPYDHRQLGRSFYRSNTDDAEVHGERFTGSCEVAVLDGFALVVRRDLLVGSGGWPIHSLDYIGYDYWASCMAHRLGYRIRLVGVRCHHLGGRTAVALKKNTDTGSEYDRAHRYIYEEFKDMLPFSCESQS